MLRRKSIFLFEIREGRRVVGVFLIRGFELFFYCFFFKRKRKEGKNIYKIENK